MTGGANGIGRAIVERLVSSGAQVHVWDLNPIELNTVTFTKVDVTQRGQIATAIETLIAQGSRIDILVNDAGYLGTLHPFDDHDPADWHRIIQVNLIGMMEVTQMVLPHMRRWGGGRIVNLGSLAGKEGLAKLAAYSAASAGVAANWLLSPVISATPRKLTSADFDTAPLPRHCAGNANAEAVDTQHRPP